MAEFEVVVEEIVFRNDQNGFTVASVKPDGSRKISAVGIMPFLAAGERVSLVGEMVEHREYGAQIKVESYTALMPDNQSDIEKYLASGIIKGVGPATSKLIVRHFGEQTLDVLEAHPEWLTEVPGIGPKRAKLIGESFAENVGMRRTMMFLQGLGLSPNMAGKVCSRFGEMTEAVIK